MICCLARNLDFAGDVSFLAELLPTPHSCAQEMMASEASLPGFEVNWQKTKVQATGTRVNVPSTVTVQGQQTAVVDKFLGSLIHSSTQSTPRHHTPQRYQSCSDAKSRNHFCKSYVNFGDQPDSLSQQC